MSLHWKDLDLVALAETVADEDTMDFRPGIPRHHATAPEEVPVLVDYIGAGVWARFVGTSSDGTPVTVTGACVGGPDQDGEVFAVQVRTYRDGEPDVVVYIGEGMPVMLCDDPADRVASRRHTLAPVFGPVERAEVIRYNRDTNRWEDLPPVFNPTAEQLAQLEQPSEPDLQLAAVHRGHLPVGAVDKPQT